MSAQSRLFDPSITDLDAQLADIAERKQNPPTDDLAVYSEFQWVSPQSQRIKAVTADLQQASRASKYIKDFETTADEWKRAINTLSAENTNAIDDFLAKSLSGLETILFSFALPFDFEQLASFAKLRSQLNSEPLVKFTSPDRPKIDSTNVSGVLSALKSQLVPALEQFVAEVRDRETKDDAERAAKLAKAKRLDEELSAYRKLLTEQRRKDVTKQDLGTNLHLMILVIGGLSVGAIALVRWFPEMVMLEWVESGQVIQFVTVMILLSVIMALGLAGLLTEQTLGTLLGGIGGYVLSQGIGRAAARTALKEQSRSNPGQS